MCLPSRSAYAKARRTIVPDNPVSNYRSTNTDSWRQVGLSAQSRSRARQTYFYSRSMSRLNGTPVDKSATQHASTSKSKAESSLDRIKINFCFPSRRVTEPEPALKTTKGFVLWRYGESVAVPSLHQGGEGSCCTWSRRCSEIITDKSNSDVLTSSAYYPTQWRCYTTWTGHGHWFYSLHASAADAGIEIWVYRLHMYAHTEPNYRGIW
jgi:hypothetical protein